MRIFVNMERTVYAAIVERDEAAGVEADYITVATRDDPSHTWGPPVRLEEEERA